MHTCISFFAVLFVLLKSSLLFGNTSDTVLVNNCDSIPVINQEIVAYVHSKINKRVGDGECWALASESLRLVGAQWDGKYQYGKLLQYDSDCIYPGDMIQFEKVTVRFQDGNQIFVQKFPHHTAVIYKVNSTGNYVLAHQNVNGKKKVITTSFSIADVKKGKYFIYRPVR